MGIGSGPVRSPLLGELETAVMNRLWSEGEGDAKSVHAALGKRRGITLNTIQSTLKRLFEKKLLERDKVSHAHMYRPAVPRAEFQREAVGTLVAEIMGGEADAMVSAFVALTERAGPEQFALLEKLVAERRRARERSKK
jgi:predicted transcriptional regulator